MTKKKIIDNPLVSVITVSFNSAKTIEQTIQSVLNQSYERIEYIIIDGASTDRTIEIIKKYQDKLACWISEPDNGIYHAMNKGIGSATGEIIGIINSDDWYEPDAIKNVVTCFNNNPEADVIHGILKAYNSDRFVYMYAQTSDFLEQTMIEHPTCFVKKEVYDQVGLFNVQYKIAADYDLLLRIKRGGFNFLLIDKVLANFRLSGISNGNFKSSIEDIEIKSKYGIISPRSKRLAKIKRYLDWKKKTIRNKLLGK